jgi:twinkle protein
MRSAGLFGQKTCRGTGKFITVTEGELDALSVSEMFNNKYDVVSLRSGAASAAKEIKQQLEWLEGYDQVVLCFDNDKAGELAVEEVKDLFSPNKLKIVKLPRKDASDMLVDNKVQEFTQCWWDAKTYRPDGIVAGMDTWEALVNKREVKSTPYPWEGLNELTKGHRPYELVTVTSGSGMGKSQFIRELEYDLLQRTNANIGVLALEEDVARTTLGIMSVAANRPLHLEEDTPVDNLRQFWEATLGTGRYYLFDHWGSTSADNLLSRVRYMAKALDCEYIILDHLSIVVSSQENGDERKAIDEIMTRLRTLVAETGIGLFLVSHLKRTSGKPHEDGGVISLQDLRGSQSIAQLSDIVIGMERDQQHEDPEVRNTTCVRILKNRYTGQTGPATWLRYELDTGRMIEVPPPSKDDGGETEF